MNVYVASKTRHIHMWQALRAAGVPIQASWLDSSLNLTDADPRPEAWTEHWSKCCAEAAAADIILLYVRSDDSTQMGALIEVGCALGAGRQVYLVSPYHWSFEHHPNVRRFDSLADAVAAIIGRNKDCR